MCCAVRIAVVAALGSLALAAQAQKPGKPGAQGIELQPMQQMQQLLPPKVVKTDPLFVSGMNIRDHRDLPEIPDAQPALAALSLMVPVTLRRLPPAIQRVRLNCNVSRNSHWEVDPRDTVGTGSTDQALVEGGFRGTIAVGVNPNDGKSLVDMRSYRCDLFGFDGSKWATLWDHPIDRETYKGAAEGRIP